MTQKVILELALQTLEIWGFLNFAYSENVRKNRRSFAKKRIKLLK